MVPSQQLRLDLKLKMPTFETAMTTLNTNEEHALREVLIDITESASEREQNLAIDRYLKLNMAIAIRNNTLSGEMFNAVIDAIKPKQKTFTHGNN